MNHKVWIGVSAFAWGSLGAQSVPVLLTQSRETLKVTEPYKWSVLVRVGGGRASGVVVAPKAYATAAHVVFEGGAWLTPDSIRSNWCNHSSFIPSTETRYARGVHRWSGYATRVANDTSEGLSSSIGTFNLDFAVVYTADAIVADASFAPTMVDPEDTGQVSFLRRAPEKTIIGYPAAREYIDFMDIGKMFQNPPGDYEIYWSGRAADPFDFEGLWTGTHYFENVETYGGNSGGPVYGRGRDDRWFLNALLVGGPVDEPLSLVRGVDEAAWELIEAAIEASGGAPVRRVVDLSGTALADGRALLNWTDRSSEESGYLVERRTMHGYTTVAELEADTETWTDDSLPPGSVAHYRVTAIQGSALSAPPSQRVVVETPGAQTALASALGEPLLFFRTTGDAPMAPDGDDVVSGKIWGMEASDLELELIGPGQLTFSWSVSSEVNPDYATPDDPYEGDIYDAFYFLQNGGQTHFISGIDIAESQSVELAAGAQTLRWSYGKDPYADEGDDRGRLLSVTWEPSPANRHPYGAYRIDGHFAKAQWFGRYSTAQFPWGFHQELGWLYFGGSSDQSSWIYCPDARLGWLYVNPEAFPFLYSAVTKGWVYFDRASAIAGAGRWFYDYTSDGWWKKD